jgi:hypothetical protein
MSFGVFSFGPIAHILFLAAYPQKKPSIPLSGERREGLVLGVTTAKAHALGILS